MIQPALTPPAEDADTYRPDPAPGPAFDRGVQRLAESLWAHVSGEAGFDDPQMQENYLADAREIAMAYPHLLTAEERGIVKS